MNKKYINLIAAVAVVAIFICLGLWKFHDVLVNPNLSLTNQGDGLWYISAVHAFNEFVREGNYSALFGDKFQYDILSLSLTEPLSSSIYWKWNWYILGSFLSPIKVYDINALIAFVLIGIAGYVLARELGANFIISLLSAFLLSHLDVFYQRMDGHLLGLGTYYAPIFLTWSAIRAGKKAILSRMLIFILLLIFNFTVNEYYGYFGFFFGCLLFAGYIFVYNKNWIIPRKIIIRNICISILLFLVLMCIIYPHYIGSKLIGVFNSYLNISPDHHFAWNEFIAYSLWNPATLFIPGFNFLRLFLCNISLYNRPVFQNTVGEMTFRIGIIIPVITLISCIYYFIKFYSKKIKSDIFIHNEFIIWVYAAVIMVIFCLNPRYIFSFVPLTFKIAPMFRVGVRSLLYFDIAIIAMFILFMQKIVNDLIQRVNLLPQDLHTKRIYKSTFVLSCLIISYFALADVSNNNFLNKFYSVSLPVTKSYSILKDKPNGFLVELPVFSPVITPPEENYIYLYNRIFHGKPILNTVYTGSENVIFREALHKLSTQMNAPDSKLLNKLKRAGVQYIVANKNSKFDFSYLSRTDLLEKIAQDDWRIIYQFKREKPVNIDINSARESFLEQFIFDGTAIAVLSKGCGPIVNIDNASLRSCEQNALIQLKSYYTRPVQLELCLVIEPLVSSISALNISSKYFSEEVELKTKKVVYKKNITILSNENIVLKLKTNRDSISYDKEKNIYSYWIKTINLKLL
ncbi:MAG: hypothetical protein V1874_12360 [Spirochaetota bacterium]